MSSAFWVRYVKYHLRWQSGFGLAWGVMELCVGWFGLPIWVSVIAMQFIGAMVYYPIDRYIFKKNTAHGYK